MKSSKFILLFAALLIGVTVASISDEVNQIISDLNVSVNNIASNLIAGTNTAILGGLNNIQNAWNVLASVRYLILNMPIVSPAINASVNTAINTIRNATTDGTIISQTITTAMQNVYNQALNNFITLSNVSSEISQCWAVARPQIIDATSTFVDEVNAASITESVEYALYVTQQTASITLTISTYQAGALACVARILPSAIRTCNTNYVS
jgi:hypothetical protein